IVQGLGGALFEAVKFENGRILNSRLAEYRVPRFSDTPQIEVEIVQRKDLPSAGAGETPLMGVAPAISNAIFAATGQRLRSLPVSAVNSKWTKGTFGEEGVNETSELSFTHEPRQRCLAILELRKVTARKAFEIIVEDFGQAFGAYPCRAFHKRPIEDQHLLDA